MIDSFFINSLNNFLSASQKKLEFIEQESFFFKHIDNIIFATILLVFILSTFASSDSIGFVALVTIFLTLIKVLVKKGERFEVNFFEAILLIYFLFVLISLCGSTLFYLSLKGFFKTFTYLGFYVSSVQYFKNNLRKIPITIGVISLCALGQGIIGFIQNFLQVDEISTWQDVSNLNPEEVMTRVYGTLQPLNPNLLGGYFVATLPTLFGGSLFTLIKKQFKAAAFFMISAILCSITLFLTGCRGAYIGLFVIVVGFVIFAGKLIWEKGQDYLKKIYLSLVGFMMTFILAVSLLITSIRVRILSIFAMRNDSSTSFRLNVYQAAFQMAKDNWVMGIGVGNQNFREIYGLYMKTGFDALSSYNIFLETAVESGIFALLAFVGFTFVAIYQAVKFIKNGKSDCQNIIMVIATISLIAILVHGLVDTVFFRPQIQFVFWMMLAVISVLLNPQKNECCTSEYCK